MYLRKLLTTPMLSNCTSAMTFAPASFGFAGAFKDGSPDAGFRSGNYTPCDCARQGSARPMTRATSSRGIWKRASARRAVSIPPPPLLLGRLARRVARVARGLLLGEQRGVLCLFLGLELRHDGGLLGGELGGLLGGLPRSLCVGLCLEAGFLGAPGFFFRLLLCARFLALAACFGNGLQLRLARFVFLVTGSRLFLEPVEQSLLGLRSTVEALLPTGAFGAAPHVSSSFASGWQCGARRTMVGMMRMMHLA